MAENVDHIQYRESVVNESFELLLEQFRGSPNIVKLLTVIAKMKQVIDNAVIGVGKLRTINTASGVYLDNIGEELGVPRNGADDESYRVVLKIRAYRTQTAGTRPQIIELLSRFTGTEDNTINTYVGYNKTFDIFFYDGCLDTDYSINELLKIFPILSSYRLGNKSGTPLGFMSYFDTEDPIQFKGFGSYFEDNVADGSVGHMASFLLHIE